MIERIRQRNYDVFMRRAAAQTAMFLVLGAIVNVAVAWGCALTIEPDWRIRGSTWKFDRFCGRANNDPILFMYGAHRWQRPGALRVRVNRYGSISGPRPTQRTRAFDEIVPHWSLEWVSVPELGGIRHDLVDPANFDNSSVHVDARGWPCVTLWGGARIVHPGVSLYLDGQAVPLDSKSHWILRVRSGEPVSANERWLPLRPILSGIVINTVFYAALVWVMLIAPSHVRRALRRKRRLCERCAYPIGVSPVCTECGAAVGARRSN